MLKNKIREMTLHPLLGDSSQEVAVAGDSEADERPVIEPARDRRQSLGVALIGLGVIVLLVAWWGVSGTADTVDQLSYIGTGVSAGACLLVVGTVLLVACEHTRDRTAILELTAQLRRLEEGLAGEFDHLDQTIRSDQLRRA